jgi:hypothetical protein
MSFFVDLTLSDDEGPAAALGAQGEANLGDPQPSPHVRSCLAAEQPATRSAAPPLTRPPPPPALRDRAAPAAPRHVSPDSDVVIVEPDAAAAPRRPLAPLDGAPAGQQRQRSQAGPDLGDADLLITGVAGIVSGAWVDALERVRMADAVPAWRPQAACMHMHTCNCAPRMLAHPHRSR